MTQRARQK